METILGAYCILLTIRLTLYNWLMADILFISLTTTDFLEKE